jgi:hypothetical protein
MVGPKNLNNVPQDFHCLVPWLSSESTPLSKRLLHMVALKYFEDYPILSILPQYI